MYDSQLTYILPFKDQSGSKFCILRERAYKHTNQEGVLSPQTSPTDPIKSPITTMEVNNLITVLLEFKDTQVKIGSHQENKKR